MLREEPLVPVRVQDHFVHGQMVGLALLAHAVAADHVAHLVVVLVTFATVHEEHGTAREHHDRGDEAEARAPWIHRTGASDF